MTEKTYRVTEMFYSIQGEGFRAGIPHVFVRLAGCNLQCSVDNEAGFDCDTDFSASHEMTAEELEDRVRMLTPRTEGVPIIWTGGEPALQLDSELINRFPGRTMCIETNGTKALDNEVLERLSHIVVSPKSAMHTIRIQRVDEWRFVLPAGHALPRPPKPADHYYLSPVFDPDGTINQRSLESCIHAVKEHHPWRLSLQTHKLIHVR